jgi:hypothetical protein
MADFERARAAVQRARDWWNSLSEDEQAQWRERGFSSWDAFWMDLRCRQGRARAGDICPNGNGNGSTTGNNDIGSSNGNGRALPKFVTMGPGPRPLVKTPRIPDFGPPSSTVRPSPNGNGNGNGNGAQAWYQNPLVWVAGAGALFLVARRRS